MTEPQLSKVLTIAQVAKLAGWSYDRMLAFLTTLNTQVNGMLLVNVGRGKARPRWTVSMNALQSVAPQWFQDRERVEQMLKDHEFRLHRLECLVDMHSAKMAKVG